MWHINTSLTDYTGADSKKLKPDPLPKKTRLQSEYSQKVQRFKHISGQPNEIKLLLLSQLNTQMI